MKAYSAFFLGSPRYHGAPGLVIPSQGNGTAYRRRIGTVQSRTTFRNVEQVDARDRAADTQFAKLKNLPTRLRTISKRRLRQHRVPLTGA